MTLEEFKNNYDWQHAFGEALTGGYTPMRDEYEELRDEKHPIEFVTHVYAADEGENDGPQWLAVVGWSGPQGPFAVMRAGCDYTGWDCQAGGVIEFFPTLAESVNKLALTREEQQRLAADLAKLGDVVEWYETNTPV